MRELIRMSALVFELLACNCAFARGEYILGDFTTRVSHAKRPDDNGAGHAPGNVSRGFASSRA